MSCALGEWQHTRTQELHQVVDSDGNIIETCRNLHLANRIASAGGHRVNSIDPSEVVKGKV